MPTDPDTIDANPAAQFCDHHYGRLIGDSSVSALGVSMYAIQHLLGNAAFFEVAYRIKHGHGPPEGWPDETTIAPDNRPDEQDMAVALDAITPVCCWLEDRDQWERVVDYTRQMTPSHADVHGASAGTESYDTDGQ